MFQRIKATREKKQAQALLESADGWHAVCVQVIEICGQVLHDETVQQGDIGISLDKADRLLFQLRNQASEAGRLLRSLAPALAPRLNLTTNRVFELRNDTARFLIRCQGPDPTAAGGQLDGVARRVYYDRAMQEVGIKARRLHTEVERDLHATWDDLQGWIAEARIRERADSITK